jgi:hypothetical protein
VAELRAVSSAVHRTVVTPVGKADPEGGTHWIPVMAPAVEEAVTRKLTTRPLGPEHSVRMLSGQSMVTGERTWARMAVGVDRTSRMQSARAELRPLWKRLRCDVGSKDRKRWIRSVWIFVYGFVFTPLFYARWSLSGIGRSL